jgi:hypothetical protein
LRGLQIGARSPDNGRRQILPQADRLVEIRKRLGPHILPDLQIVPGEESEGILRLELDGAVEVGACGIKAAAPAAQSLGVKS